MPYNPFGAEFIGHPLPQDPVEPALEYRGGHCPPVWMHYDVPSGGPYLLAVLLYDRLRHGVFGDLVVGENRVEAFSVKIVVDHLVACSAEVLPRPPRRSRDRNSPDADVQ